MIATNSDNILLALIYQISSRTGEKAVRTKTIAEILRRKQSARGRSSVLYETQDDPETNEAVISDDTFVTDLRQLISQGMIIFGHTELQHMGFSVTPQGTYFAEILELPAKLQKHLDTALPK